MKLIIPKLHGGIDVTLMQHYLVAAGAKEGNLRIPDVFWSYPLIDFRGITPITVLDYVYCILVTL